LAAGGECTVQRMEIFLKEKVLCGMQGERETSKNKTTGTKFLNVSVSQVYSSVKLTNIHCHMLVVFDSFVGCSHRGI
jgi:hypothetical protein